ncbi:DUF6160 family protein [Undibacterium sp.]|uniref:DUF6160 family protein n=1 Tax=Undibacterium sp. TaxID=1914977 RepID=UPI00260139F9|nr:DUF6160 family protein [Undibacterium sp.]MCX7219309.1 hypothetical protein [Burkholderiales bacterium]
MNFLRALRLSLLCPLLALSSVALAADLQALNDEALSGVQGRDGVSFLLGLNANIGSVHVGTYDTDNNAASIIYKKLALTGTLGVQLNIFQNVPGMPDIINLSLPDITSNYPLQYAYDLEIAANGRSLGTSVAHQNMSYVGSHMQWTTSGSGGLTFGLGLKMSTENIFFQPNGRGIANGQMNVNGLKVANADGTATPWVIADVVNQPGSFRVINDANGNSNFQFGIAWPDVQKDASAGSLHVDNISFTTPTGKVDLGASSIGSMQIQYLNVKFK